MGIINERTALAVLGHAAQFKHGFLAKEDVGIIANCEETRLQQCLIRFQGCRLVCAAQDVKHIIESLENSGDYCRDVSIPASDPIWKRLGVR